MINYRDEEGVDITSTTNVPGGVINLPMAHNKLEPSPLEDIPPTVIMFLTWLNGQLDQVVLPRVPIDNPPPSGTLYNLVQEAGNRVFNPQLRNLNTFFGDICRLIEEQVIAGGIKVKTQGVSNRKYYETQITPVDLKKSHIIKVEFTARTPWSQMDTAQVAQMLITLGLPKIWVWEHILKVQDPKLLQDLVALEIYEHSPEGMMKRAVEVLMDRGYTFEAQKLVEQMDKMDNQETLPSEQPPPPTGGV